VGPVEIPLHIDTNFKRTGDGKAKTPPDSRSISPTVEKAWRMLRMSILSVVMKGTVFAPALSAF